MTQPPRAPVPVEIAAQAQIRRLLMGLFAQGQITPELWWSTEHQRYIVALPYDVAVPPGVMARLPWNVLGVPVQVVPRPPHAVTGTGSFPGPTLTNGMSVPSMARGVAIGWPVITISGRRPSILRPTHAPRTTSGYCGPARFPLGRYHDSWPPVEVVPPWANCPTRRLVT